jgi:alkylhydroperoxidase family enzyme
LQLLLAIDTVDSQDSPVPKLVPKNRAEMLLALDALKHRQARLPLPPFNTSDATPEMPKTDRSQNPGGVSMGIVNNGRMRSLYLPPQLQTRSGKNTAVTDVELPYEFATELFWIVSRVNNCQYCLGHQEHKLKSVGVAETTLLSLDTDWTSFPAKEQAAFQFTRQLTIAPYSISAEDIDRLRVHFSDAQILDLTFMVGRYNSTNRWTDSLGIPQEEERVFDSELEKSMLNQPSTVAISGFPDRIRISDQESWNAEFRKQAVRKPRLTFAGVPNDRERLLHESLLLKITAAGEAYVEQLRQARIVGKLPVRLQDKIAYVAAREDHAWYMQNISRQRLLAAGLSDDSIFGLGSNELSSSADDIALRFAKRLTTQPQSMTDADIDLLLAHFSPDQAAEIVYHIGVAAILDRVTEVAQLGWEQ